MKNLFTSQTLKLTAVLLISFVFYSCANVVNIENCTSDEPYGFWFGLWHGIISPISFFGNLFYEDIAKYATNNNGGWYDFGFVLGAGILFGGGSKASCKKS
jgi:hypothetical protein